MEITPDFSLAVESNDQPVPDGIYSARIVGAEMKQSQKGNSYIAWKLQIFGADGELASQNNRMLFYNTMTAGKGASMLKTFIKAALGELPEGSFDTDTLLGTQVSVVVKTRMLPDGTLSAWSDIKAVKAYSF